MTSLESIFNKIETDDRPHHIANIVLRSFHAEFPPINVEKIIAGMELLLIRDKNLTESGMLDASQNPKRIIVNASDHMYNQRFTMAHELGHLFLHNEEKEILFRNRVPHDQNTIKEQQANEFAASLLVPLWLLEPIVSSGKQYTGNKLSELFQVSKGTIGFQLKKLL